MVTPLITLPFNDKKKKNSLITNVNEPSLQPNKSSQYGDRWKHTFPFLLCACVLLRNSIYFSSD